MHSYSTDNYLRPKVIGALGLVSYFLISGFEYVVGMVVETFSLGIVVGVPSWGLVFVAVFTGFERWGWNTWIARKTGAVKSPDLSGKWEGWIETSYNDEPPIPSESTHPDNNPDSEYTRIQAALDIEQTWWEMGVHFTTGQSSSDSEGATILTGEGKWPNLNYQYKNDPSLNTPEGMELHYGTADLELKEQNHDGRVLEGVYYTGPRRENHGRMYFEKVAD